MTYSHSLIWHAIELKQVDWIAKGKAPRKPTNTTLDAVTDVQMDSTEKEDCLMEPLTEIGSENVFYTLLAYMEGLGNDPCGREEVSTTSE